MIKGLQLVLLVLAAVTGVAVLSVALETVLDWIFKRK